ncbi:MAG TPA: DNA-formamidopyrimidine glycosylase family protein [Acidobacteriaceae bacterium]|nr:DNA-formamidopyrimidine glycosylase family protein [Acidobacteriaceae bacterium]
MPEGDTIYRAARALNSALADRVVTGFETGLAKLARVNDDTPIVGRTVERVESRGKWCLMYFSGDLILVTHMLMSGSWHLYRTGEKWRMSRAKMRVVVKVGGSSPQTQQVPVPPAKQIDWEAVLFNAQIAEFHTARSLERSSQVPRLGPDILAGEFTVEAGVARLEAYARDHPDAEVGVVLLNQRVLAGLGNVYKSEVAFAAEVNPWRTMRTVTHAEMEKMVEFSLRYMRANVIDGKGDGIVTYAGHRRTTHSMSKEERLWVYGRQDQECRRCGNPVKMQKQGEQARVTYWCPQCQPCLGNDLI